MSTDRTSTAPTCAACGDVLGIYEPIVVLAADAPPKTTSRAAEEPPGEGLVMHLDCYRGGGD